ncbi:hypothetical protein [Natronococcus roseus]|uniref:hypothetical protein n=1 Tax=Natronococcus roseus TaxID=1052014 RepID=UPI00374D289F
MGDDPALIVRASSTHTFFDRSVSSRQSARSLEPDHLVVDTLAPVPFSSIQ